MKKFFACFLAMALCLTLCACPATEQPAPSGRPQVHIHVGKLEPGMTAKDVLVEVTIDNQPVTCRVALTGFAWDGYWDMAEDEAVPEDYFVRLDIFYSLPTGCDVEDVDITMDCDGGSYDGTGSISNDAQGNVEAWSRAFYGKEPLPPETEPTEVPTQPTETPTQPTQPDHTHTWVEQPGPSIIDCSLDRTKTYKCSCGETKTETIPAPGHDTTVSTTDPTCTDSGIQTHRCQRCSYVLKVEIPATGHSWTEWEKKTGLVHSRICSVCGEEEEANHNIPAGEVTCTDCGADIIN